MSPVVFRSCYFAVCAAAAAAPWMRTAPETAGAPAVPPWPSRFDDRLLEPVALSPGEERFNARFPGAVARFTDGERQFIFRWATTGTRKLHSSADCFRGLGYRIEPEPPRMDGNGARWSCFSARRGSCHLQVRERIADERSGQAWCDVSAWYWSTLLRQSRGPWMAVTVIEAAGHMGAAGPP